MLLNSSALAELASDALNRAAATTASVAALIPDIATLKDVHRAQAMVGELASRIADLHIRSAAQSDSLAAYYVEKALDRHRRVFYTSLANDLSISTRKIAQAAEMAKKLSADLALIQSTSAVRNGTLGATSSWLAGSLSPNQN